MKFVFLFSKCSVYLPHSFPVKTIWINEICDLTLFYCQRTDRATFLLFSNKHIEIQIQISILIYDQSHCAPTLSPLFGKRQTDAYYILAFPFGWLAGKMEGEVMFQSSQAENRCAHTYAKLCVGSVTFLMGLSSKCVFWERKSNILAFYIYIKSVVQMSIIHDKWEWALHSRSVW